MSDGSSGEAAGVPVPAVAGVTVMVAVAMAWGVARAGAGAGGPVDALPGSRKAKASVRASSAPASGASDGVGLW